MIAPATVVPQIAAPSQKRQTGVVRNVCCHWSPSWWRLAESEACSQGSQASRKLRGVASAMKSRLALSFPNRPQRMLPSNPARTAEFPQGRKVERIANRSGRDLIIQFASGDDKAGAGGFRLGGQ